MPQADGKHQISRFVLHFPDEGDNGWYRFKVNPENYTYEKPQRSTILKTKSDIVVEDYGKDIEVINFSGTTGFRSIKEGNKTKNGKDKLDDLVKLVDKYAKSGGSGNRQQKNIIFYNMTDGVYKKVHLAPQGIKIARSVNEPLLFRYDITLMVLGEAFEPDRNSISDPEFGNLTPSNEQSLQDKILDMFAPAQEARKEINNAGLTTGRVTPKTYSQTSNGKPVSNPRTATNGLSSTLNNMSLIIGYGNGGIRY